MARYIDTQKVTVPRGFFNKNLGVPDLLKWLEAQPTADVVPRAELERALRENRALSAFKDYFDDLYGQGLEIAKWHQNGDTEPFDSFYDSALDEYEAAFLSEGRKDEISKATDS